MCFFYSFFALVFVEILSKFWNRLLDITKLITGGGWNKIGGLENLKEKNNWGQRLFGTWKHEYF